ncbi:MAG: PIN domain-containing protein [Candidatus Firestonebacteria bacterium]
MMKNKLYLDTSIPNAYFDNRVPLRQLITQKWFQNDMQDYSVCISALVLEEISMIEEKDLRENLINIVMSSNPIVHEIDKISIRLADLYLKKEAIPRKENNDALHIAIAVVNSIPFLASWNFKHIVKARTIYAINEINLKHKYGLIEIGSLEIYGGAKYGNLL